MSARGRKESTMMWSFGRWGRSPWRRLRMGRTGGGGGVFIEISTYAGSVPGGWWLRVSWRPPIEVELMKGGRLGWRWSLGFGRARWRFADRWLTMWAYLKYTLH